MSETVTGEAYRRARTWMVSIPEHGVYGHGRTLKAAAESTAAGLELAGVDARVELVATTTELVVMRAARAAYEEALEIAVVQLALRRTTLKDMATATGLKIAQVRRILEARAAREDESAELSEETGTAPAADPVGSG